eukprot:CCRYP_011466-RA/>CCRYP_011466-RA protein AED:0.42 eAED:0.42 QI:0/0/0/1/1/1/2/0/195
MHLCTVVASALQSCVDLLEEYSFNGLDIDWEYPRFAEDSGTPKVKGNFSLLLDEVHSALDLLKTKTGKSYGLMVALSCWPNHIANIDTPHLNSVLDEFHLMTYDFNGAWSDLTGVHSLMHYQGWGPKKFSLDDCVRMWHEQGTPCQKLTLALVATLVHLQMQRASNKVILETTLPIGVSMKELLCIIIFCNSFHT